MNTITSSAPLCGGTPSGKTNAPTATVEQLQLVMNPIVGLFSRRLLNTTQQTEDVLVLRTARPTSSRPQTSGVLALCLGTSLL